MRPLLGLEAARSLDASAGERFGLSGDQLMEAAALGMASALEGDAESRGAMDRAAERGGVPALAVAGAGNNGGDAIAVLRRLAFAGYRGLVAVAAPEPGPAAARRLREARLAGVAVLDPSDGRASRAATEAGLVLDGIAGIGYRGPARPAFARLKSIVEAGAGRVVAVDVPSGVGAFAVSGSLGYAEPEPPARARLTLSVAPLKAEAYYPGYRPYAGRIVPVTGVFPVSEGRDASAWLLEPGDLGALLPLLDPDCHKGTRGALAVFAGCPGSVGAAALCARAAQASGAGSVTLLVDDDILGPLSSRLETQMVRPASDPGTRRFSAALAGPGWGSGAAAAGGREETLRTLWEAALPLALDADALRLLASKGWTKRCSPLVLTPHPGEYVPLAAPGAGEDELRLASLRARYDTAASLRETAARLGAVVVLKGATTWICDPEGRLAVWDGREPTLAVAGSGDALAGLVAGLIARGAPAWDAARAAVIIHGLSGRIAARRGFYEAGDIVAEAARLAYGGSGDGNQG